MIILHRSEFFLSLCMLECKLGVEVWARHFGAAYHFLPSVSTPVSFTFRLAKHCMLGKLRLQVVSLHGIGLKHFC